MEIPTPHSLPPPSAVRNVMGAIFVLLLLHLLHTHFWGPLMFSLFVRSYYLTEKDSKAALQHYPFVDSRTFSPRVRVL